MNLEGKEESLSAPSNWYHTPAISPDVTKVASAVLIDANLDIYIWDIARETLMRLTFEKGSDVLPLWTHDGKRIIFTSEREGNRGIYWKAADGTGEMEKLVSIPDKNLFPWYLLKDGKTLVVVEMDSDYTHSFYEDYQVPGINVRTAEKLQIISIKGGGKRRRWFRSNLKLFKMSRSDTES